MKQITYQLRGMVTEAMAPAIVASCESLPGVRSVSLSPLGEEAARITLSLSDEMPVPEQLLASILNQKGLTLLADTREEHVLQAAPVVEPSPEVPPSPAAPAPSDAAHYVTTPPPKPGRTVGLGAAVATVVASVVLAILMTFSVTVAYMQRDTTPTVEENADHDLMDELALLDRLFRSESVIELGEDFPEAVIRAYIAETGDRYAAYYNAEEYQAFIDQQEGDMCGIGVSIVEDTLTLEGAAHAVLTVISVYPDSPAEKAGVKPGDAIMYVIEGDQKTSVAELGYTETLNRMKGEEGTTCAFAALRRTDAGDYEEISFTATRQKITARSVTGRIYGPDPSVGIIKITGFDYPTCAQFVETLEALKADGCTSFVLDLRGNPGGLLDSVVDIMTLFLEEGDTLLSTLNSRDQKNVIKLSVAADGTVQNGHTGNTLKPEDIGRYRDLRFTVLVNGASASASELFTANMRDHELALIVGETTFGKGSMQTTFPLSWYGYEGAIKFTTNYYYPPSGEDYNGIGITPDVAVKMDEAYKNININLLTDEQDNQLAEAVKALKPAA